MQRSDQYLLLHDGIIYLMALPDGMENGASQPAGRITDSTGTSYDRPGFFTFLNRQG
ncbi:MAG: hypothetical protein JXA18_11275 [Chitinispirillaceae bacterium]|nr:hypothetical protein [Chitinispirillaceae bacterium]